MPWPRPATISSWLPAIARLRITEPPPTSEPATDPGESVAEDLETIAGHERPPIRTYPIKIGTLNTLLGGGIKTRQLAVVAAPPADGKSALVVDLVLALQADLPALIVSTELESDELLARVAGNIIGCPWTAIVAGEISRERVLEAVRGKRIRVIGCDKIHADQGEAMMLIAREAMIMRDRWGVSPWIVVDYMQDLARGDNAEGERHRVGQVARKLRIIAQSLDCPVWAVCSVGREFYNQATIEKLRKSDDARVYMRAAKESGDVDFAAATVLFLDVGIEPEGGGMRPARIAVAKCRHGRTGFAGARFDGATGRWIGDASALLELSAPATEARAISAKANVDEDVIIAFVRSGQRMTQRELRDAVPGLSKQRTEDAIKSAVARGRLVRVTDCHLDATHRQREREVILEPGSAPRTPLSK